MDLAGTSLGMPRRELDFAHPGPDVHQIARARPNNEVADPDATMAELEKEHQDRESELLSRISDLEDRVRLYEERLDELSSTNSMLHEALHNQEAGVKARFDAVQRPLDAAL
jgi:predicted nuclease with TOPRIM domain